MSYETQALKRPYDVAFPPSVTEISDPVSESDVVINLLTKPGPISLNDVLPLEMITKFLQFLTVGSTVRCRLVCRDWRDLIAQDNYLQKKITLAWTKKFIRTYLVNEKVFIALIRVEASIDLEESQATIRRICNPDVQFEATLQFLKIKAKKDPEGARADARSLQNKEHRCKALIEIERENPQVPTAVDEPLAAVKHLPQKYLQCKALLEIFEIRVKIDSEKAKTILRSAKSAALAILKPRSQSAYLIKVYKSQVDIDPTGAKTTLREAESAARLIDDPYIQEQVKSEIKELDQAQTTAEAKSVQPKSPYETITELNETLKKAEENVAIGTDPVDQSSARLAGGKEKIEIKDLERARTDALEIQDPNDKDEAAIAVLKAFF